ncbi:MAG: caspase family protein [Acidimicrobiales bacterium]
MAALRRALLVGINAYENFGALGGCLNDVDALERVLARHEDENPNFACQKLVNASRDALTSATRTLLAPGADLALFYFAGHGAPLNGDVSVCTRDGTNDTPGVSLSTILGQIAGSSVREVIIVLDCCFSGAAGAVPQLGGEQAVLRQGVSILAASRGDQTSAEQADRGVFSTYFEAALNGGAADVLGKVTVASVYAYLSELFGAWDQRPTFKSNVDRLHELRHCKPAVPLEELRRLPEFFPQFNDEHPLDPSYEWTMEMGNREHETIFAILQRCRAAKLVEPVGHEHLYWAALESRSCRLTPLGHHYWRLASLDRL